MKEEGAEYDILLNGEQTFKLRPKKEQGIGERRAIALDISEQEEESQEGVFKTRQGKFLSREMS